MVGNYLLSNQMGELIRESSWRRTLASSKRDEDTTTNTIRVLTFEVATYMCKLINLWRLIQDDNIHWLTNDALRHPGTKTLVSNDEDYLFSLAIAEMLDSIRALAAAVSHLGRKCGHPALRRFDGVFRDLVRNGIDPWGLEYTRRNKMGHKARKMERFIAASASLYEEMDALVEMEQRLPRMESKADTLTVTQNRNLIEFKHKVHKQRLRVDHLKSMSPWTRTYDYTARLLARSLFTIVGRINQVFGSQYLRKLDYKSTSLADLEPQMPPSCLLEKRQFSFRNNKYLGCLVPGQYTPVDIRVSRATEDATMSLSYCLLPPCNNLLNNAPPTTLGAAGLALHYAKLIVLIEKLFLCPCFLGLDAREDLYSRLPSSMRFALSSKLKPSPANSTGNCTEPVVAEESRKSMGTILDWLAPLARNMLKWEAVRSFEQKQLVPGSNVLLLQTLFFANRVKTEAVITELLVGLNDLWMFIREKHTMSNEMSAGSEKLSSFL